MEDTLFYKPSGKFGPLAPVLMLLLGVPLGLLLGAVYGLVDYYSPIIYLNAVLLVVAGMLLSGIMLAVSRKVHNRNPLLAGLGGLVGGVAAVYAAWVAWIWVLFGYAPDALIFSPATLIPVAGRIAEQGTWSLGSSGTPVKGLMLQLIWGVEALTLIGAAAVLPFYRLRSTPYSETEGRWADQQEELPPFAAMPKDQRRALRDGLRRGAFEVLGGLRPAQEGDESFITCKGRTTDPPGAEVFMTLDAVDVVRNAKGEPTLHRDRLASNLLVDTAAWEEMRRSASASAPARPAGVTPDPAPPPAAAPTDAAPPPNFLPPTDPDDRNASPNGLPGMPPPPPGDR